MLESQKKELKTKIAKVLRESLKNDPLPTDNSAKEQFFLNEVGRADELSNKGGDDVQTALAFYRALAVYPSPIELLGIYDKSVKKPVYEILRDMIVIEPPAALRMALGGASMAAAASAGASEGASIGNVE